MYSDTWENIKSSDAIAETVARFLAVAVTRWRDFWAWSERGVWRGEFGEFSLGEFGRGDKAIFSACGEAFYHRIIQSHLWRVIACSRSFLKCLVSF